MSRYRTAIKIGAALAGAAIAASQDAASAERSNPPIGNFVEADGIRLHYVRRGSGQQQIVFLHGNGSMVEEIAASGLLDQMAQRHQVFAFDRPGFGHSERPRNHERRS